MQLGMGSAVERHHMLGIYMQRATIVLVFSPGLTSLSIKDSVDLTVSPEVIRHLSSLETRRLEDSYLEELPKWIST